MAGRWVVWVRTAVKSGAVDVLEQAVVVAPAALGLGRGCRTWRWLAGYWRRRPVRQVCAEVHPFLRGHDGDCRVQYVLGDAFGEHFPRTAGNLVRSELRDAIGTASGNPGGNPGGNDPFNRWIDGASGVRPFTLALNDLSLGCGCVRDVSVGLGATRERDD